MYISENWPYHPKHSGSNYSNRFSRSSSQGFEGFVRNILPPPPDRRQVVLKEQTSDLNLNQKLIQQLTAKQTSSSEVQDPRGQGHVMEKRQPTEARKLEISSANTTLIGDYISTVFPQFQSKWLVQACGNATFGSTLEAIQQCLITVDRRYVFFQLGGNQIRTACADSLFNNVSNLVAAVRDKCIDSRIYFIGILPRPIDNQEVKPLIMKANRWLAHAVERVDKLFGRIRFLPVQLAFLQGSVPNEVLYNPDDRHTLSQAGATLFRATVFQLAGFVKNTVP